MKRTIFSAMALLLSSVAGCGGGYDIMGALPLIHELRARDIPYALASFSFTYLPAIERAVQDLDVRGEDAADGGVAYLCRQDEAGGGAYAAAVGGDHALGFARRSGRLLKEPDDRLGCIPRDPGDDILVNQLGEQVGEGRNDRAFDVRLADHSVQDAALNPPHAADLADRPFDMDAAQVEDQPAAADVEPHL